MTDVDVEVDVISFFILPFPPVNFSFLRDRALVLDMTLEASSEISDFCSLRGLIFINCNDKNTLWKYSGYSSPLAGKNVVRS